MAEVDAQAYAVTSLNAAAVASNSVETQQPGGSGALRQVTVTGDATTRANMQTVKAASTAAVAGDMAAVVAIHPSSPLPTGTNSIGIVTQSDTAATGTISATDALGGTPGGAGVLISTAPTASSFVATTIPGGTSQIDVQILGTATGTYYFEYSMDSTTGSDGNWVTGLFRQGGINNTVLVLGATTNGIFRGAAAAYKYFRVRNVAGTTPSNAITIRFSNGGGTVFLNAAIPAGSNVIGKVSIDQTTPGTTNLVALAANQSVNNAQVNGVTVSTGNGVSGTGVQRVTLASDSTGQVALATGTNSIGTVQPGNTANSTPWLVKQTATTTSSGLLIAKLLSAATTNATLVLTGTRTVYGWHLFNTSAAVKYVRIYNKATAPTVGTDSPIFVLPLPAGGGAVMPIGPLNIACSLGFGYSITGAAADLDATAVAANDVVGTIFYI